MIVEMLISQSEILQRLARSLGKPCMLLSTSSSNVKDIREAAPYLDAGQALNLMATGNAMLVFDTEESMTQCYEQTVGDDGPTGANPYNGPGSVYALTCDSAGHLQTENT